MFLRPDWTTVPHRALNTSYIMTTWVFIVYNLRAEGEQIMYDKNPSGHDITYLVHNSTANYANTDQPANVIGPRPCVVLESH